MNFEDLKDPELQEQLKTCNSPEELLALARELGFELSDEALDSIAGGREWYEPTCRGNKADCPRLSHSLGHSAV